MKLKSLIWKDEVDNTPKSKEPTFTENVRKEEIPVQIPIPVQVKESVVKSTVIPEKVKKIYDEEFRKYDQPGVIDYYEFHNGVINAGINPTTVTMMYNFLKGMNPTLDKTSLITQAQSTIQNLDTFIDSAKTLSEKKKEVVRENTNNQKKLLEVRKVELLEQIRKIQEELTSIDNTLSNITDDEIKVIDENFNSLQTVHNENKSNINQIITILHATGL